MNFCSFKDTVKRMKVLPQTGRKFLHLTSDAESMPVFRIKNSHNSVKRKQNSNNKNGHNFEHFTKDVKKMANKHLKTCSISVICKKYKLKP